MTHAYGWKPSPPDRRDYQLRIHEVDLPGGTDLRANDPSIWDQSQLGSCVAHGSPAGAIHAFVAAGMMKPNDFMPSRLFHYYEGRVLEGTTSYDSGLTIRDGVKAINKYGLPPESDWEYDISKFTEKPPQQAYTDAVTREATVYAAVDQDLTSMKTVLASGLPIIIGFTVYESFESDAANSTGQIPMPGDNEQVLGGHCMLVVGYGSDKFICRNSWGTGWGDNGYCYMPFEYLTDSNLADDFWVIKTMSGPGPQPVPPAPPVPSPNYDAVDKAAREALTSVTGEPVVNVRSRPGVSDTFKSGGVEILVKNLHPNV